MTKWRIMVRDTDPDTSKDAAKSFNPTELEALVLAHSRMAALQTILSNCSQKSEVTALHQGLLLYLEMVVLSIPESAGLQSQNADNV